MRLGEQSRNLLAQSDHWRMLEGVIAVFLVISGAAAVTIIPFTRKDFGERYLGWINLFIGYSLLGVFVFFGNLIWAANSHAQGLFDLVNLFWLAFIGLSLYHRSEINRKNKKGEVWHSMFIGEPIVPLPLPPETIYKVVEPAVVLLGALLLFNLSPGVGLWLAVSSVCLLFNNHLFYFQQRQRLLNARDAWIEAQYMPLALSGKPPKETAGFVIPASNLKLINSNVHLKHAFNNLAVEMKEMIDDNPFDTAA